jgi:hypothetical protein
MHQSRSFGAFSRVPRKAFDIEEREDEHRVRHPRKLA